MKKIIFIFIITCYSAYYDVKILKDKQSIALASHWILHYFIENGKEIYPDAKLANITISHNLKEFGGHASCNAIGGKLKTYKNRICFSKIISTKIFCDQQGIEDKFLDNLAQCTHYKISGGELFLYKGKKLILVLESFRN